MKKLLAIVALAVPMVASAEVGGFVNGGLNFSSYDVDFNDGDRIEFDNGTGFNLEGGIRFKPGLMVKASYSFAKHDGGELITNDRHVGSFDEEINVDELRLGFYYAPPQKGVVGFRVGGGYERVSTDFPDISGSKFKSDGVFVEAALLLNAGQIASFDIGGAAMSLEDDDHNDSVGAEFRAGVTFHAGPIDIGVAYRALAITTDFDDYSDDEDDVIGELRLTVGGKWGYPGK